MINEPTQVRHEFRSYQDLQTPPSATQTMMEAIHAVGTQILYCIIHNKEIS